MFTLSQQLKRVVLTLCEDVGSPLSAQVAKLVKEENYGLLVNLTIDPRTYTSSHSYLQDAAVVELLRKFDGFSIPGIDKKGVALENFFSSERSCKVTNDRLSVYLHAQGPFQDPGELKLFEHFEWLKSWIRKVLGPIPSEIVPRFGPGATYNDVSQFSTVPDKMSSRPSITSEARCLLPLWSSTAWSRALTSEYPHQSDPEIVRGNRFTTVPKDARKDRGIAIEPSVNVFFQLGVGRVIRDRLHRNAGIDLTYGQDHHRRMAMVASRTGSHCTIDLSNASDTVSKNLVKLLLPSGWHDLLFTLRSPCTLINGQWHHLEKFSSMGNGFTFELETLLFAAISSLACHLHCEDPDRSRNASVYGDDIILPTIAGKTAITLLKFFGFTPNQSKTFLEGPFRESCGGDFFNGEAVRPHYLKEDPNEPAKWISLANGIRRMGHQDSITDFRYSFLWRTWLRVLDAIPGNIRRLRGPEDLGDLVIHDSREYWSTRPSSRCPQSKQIEVWAPVSRRLSWRYWKPEIVFASALYGLDQQGVTPRGGTYGYKSKWIAYPC